MKFGAVCAFVAVWAVVVYAPLAHMVWGGDGSPRGRHDRGARTSRAATWCTSRRASPGSSCASSLGRRKGFGVLCYRPHNVPFVALGAALLWFGWFGFNAGCEFAADGVAATRAAEHRGGQRGAALRVLDAHRARARWGSARSWARRRAWWPVSWSSRRRPGFVEPWAAVVMGLDRVAPSCYWAVSQAQAAASATTTRWTPSACHCVGGIAGGILTGLFCVPGLSWTGHGGLLYTGDWSLLGAQVLGILVTIAFVAIADVVLGLIIKACFAGSLRVSAEDEAAGLDVAVHGESAYPAYLGLD